MVLVLHMRAAVEMVQLSGPQQRRVARCWLELVARVGRGKHCPPQHLPVPAVLAGIRAQEVQVALPITDQEVVVQAVARAVAAVHDQAAVLVCWARAQMAQAALSG